MSAELALVTKMLRVEAKICEIIGLGISKRWSILSIVSDDVNQVSLHLTAKGSAN